MSSNLLFHRLLLVFQAKLFEELIEPHVVVVNFKASRFDLRDRKHLADDALETSRFAVNDIETFHARAGIVLAILNRGFDVQADIGERRSQLMRRLRNEAIARLFGDALLRDVFDGDDRRAAVFATNGPHDESQHARRPVLAAFDIVNRTAAIGAVGNFANGRQHAFNLKEFGNIRSNDILAAGGRQQAPAAPLAYRTVHLSSTSSSP